MIEHLKSANIFDVKRIPTVSFEVISIKPGPPEIGENEYTVKGRLTFKGITGEITCSMHIEVEKDKIWNNTQFKLNLSDWDIDQNDSAFFEGLDSDLQYDELYFGMVLVAHR